MQEYKLKPGDKAASFKDTLYEKEFKALDISCSGLPFSCIFCSNLSS
jgi:hypothetical protein